MSEIAAINKRLSDLNKEFQELSTLKKELTGKEQEKKMKDLFSKYKYIVKNDTVEEFDYTTMIKKGNVGFSYHGLPIVTDGQEVYPVGVTEEEAELRIKVEKLINVSDKLKDEFAIKDKRKKKQYSVEEVYDMFIHST